MKRNLRLDPQWRGRRTWVIVHASLCWAVILAILFLKIDSRPAEAAMTMAFVYLIGITGSYVFGAAWERVGGVPGGNYYSGGYGGQPNDYYAPPASGGYGGFNDPATGG